METQTQHLDLVAEVETILRAQESAGWMVGDLMVRELGQDDIKVEDFIRNDLQPRLEARGLDIEYERLRAYYRVAKANPPEVRNGVSFTAAEEAGDKPERFGWYQQHGSSLSKRQVRKLRGDRRLDTAQGSKNASIEEKVGAIKDLTSQLTTADPEALKAAMASLIEDDSFRTAVAEAQLDRQRDRRDAADRGWHNRGGKLAELDDFMKAMMPVDSAHMRMNEALEAFILLPRLTAAQRAEAQEAVETVKSLATQLSLLLSPMNTQ